MTVVTKADRVRVVGAVAVLCITPAAGSALKGDFEAKAAQRTSDPGGAHWSSRRGLSMALHHPAARCSWNAGTFKSAAVIDRGGMSRGSLGQAKQRQCSTFWLSCGTDSRYASGPTQLDAPRASCCGARGFAHVQDSVQTVRIEEQPMLKAGTPWDDGCMGSLCERVGAEEEGLSCWGGSHRLAFGVITQIGGDLLCTESTIEPVRAYQSAAPRA